MSRKRQSSHFWLKILFYFGMFTTLVFTLCGLISGGLAIYATKLDITNQWLYVGLALMIIGASFSFVIKEALGILKRTDGLLYWNQLEGQDKFIAYALIFLSLPLITAILLFRPQLIPHLRKGPQ